VRTQLELASLAQTYVHTRMTRTRTIMRLAYVLLTVHMASALLASRQPPTVRLSQSLARPASSSIGDRPQPALLTSHRASPPAMSIAIPTATVASFWPVVAAGGACGILAQLGLQAIFDRSPDPIFSRSSGTTAHSVIAAAFTLFVSVVGVIGWWLAPFSGASSAASRVLTPLGSARWLGAFACGMIGLWDTPTCFAVKELRKPSFILHHFAMAAVGGFGAWYLPSHYGLFFLGVVELSSFPLCIYEGLERAYDIASEEDSCAPERCQRLMKLRDVTQAIATAAFIVVRLYLFTRVTFFQFWPDALSVLPTLAAGGQKNTIRFLMYSSASFVALQMFWFGQIVQQIFVAKWFAAKEVQ